MAEKFDIDKVGLTGEKVNEVPEQERELVKMTMLFVRHGYNKALMEVEEFVFDEASKVDISYAVSKFCKTKMEEMQQMDNKELIEFFKEIEKSIKDQ